MASKPLLLVGFAGTLAALLIKQSQHRRDRPAALRKDVARWEDEGGSVPGARDATTGTLDPTGTMPSDSGPMAGRNQGGGGGL
jgi:hypothetical protein